MANIQHFTAPIATKELPKGIPYIIGNEAAERFSFYGMKGILVVFIHQYLHLLSDNPTALIISRSAAIEKYHAFTSWVYITPILGALLADTILGKYRTILSLSMVYCLGHLCLAFMGSAGMSPEAWLMSGLALISLGSGGIKPCVSAHVGDQFGSSNGHWLSKVFGWFYISINVGAFVSTILTPKLLELYGPHWAFGVPGVLMALATVVFWMGRNVFIHIPPPGKAFVKETLSPEGLGAILKLSCIFVFVAVFWALFDQTGSSWVLQAEDLNRHWLGVHWLSSQIQAINPIMIIVFVPIFTGIKTIKWPGLYALVDRVFPLSPLRKVSIGFFVMVVGFAMIALVQHEIDQGGFPSIGWQVFAYAILTGSEVMVSITCLEFAYTQSPRAMKSMIMALFLMSVSLGNIFTAQVNAVIQVPDQLAAAAQTHQGLNVESRKHQDGVLDVEDIKALVTQRTDLNGNALHYTALPDQADKHRITLVGPDAKIGSNDDIHVDFNIGGGKNVRTASDGVLQQAYDLIEEHFKMHNNRLPTTQEGERLIAALSDLWGSQLRYRLVNRDRFRITSLGADKNYMTPNDIVWVTDISRPSPQPEGKIDDYNWRERRLVELKGDAGVTQINKERGGISTIEFAKQVNIGGQTNLEGADYFWFFTQLMLVTAFLFVLVAYLYKPQEYLQEEVST
jgi:proton-dependent oligopeptide transporter, POT family